LEFEAVVAEEHRVIAAVVGDDAEAAVVEKIGGGDGAACDGAAENPGERTVGHFFKLSFAEIVKHQQRFLVADFAVIKLDVVDHRAIDLDDVGPAVVIVIEKFHGDAAEENAFVADAGAEGGVGESAVFVGCVEAILVRNRDA